MAGAQTPAAGPAPPAARDCQKDEVQVILGALDMATKTAEAACTPLSKVGLPACAPAPPAP